MLAEIPGTDGFTINTIGQVYDKQGKLRNNYINGDGYITTAVKLLDGKTTTIAVHRLLAMAHIPKDREDRIEVNHRNGIKKDIRKENLEWVTPFENNIHSELLRDDSLRKKLVIFKNNKPFDSAKNLEEASKITNLPSLVIWDHLKNGTVSSEGFHFQYILRNKNIPEELRKYEKSKGIRRNIKIRDTETGEVLRFVSLTDAARHYNTYSSAIYQAIQKTKNPKLLQLRYQVTYDDCEFPELSDDDLNKAKGRCSKKVFGYNVQTKETILTDSAAEFIKKTGLSRKAVTTVLANGELRKVGCWFFIYSSKQNDEKMMAFVKSAV